MTAITVRSQTHAVAPNRRRRRIALQVTLGVSVVFVGILGTLDHCGIRRVVPSWINLHALFGALLFALVVARLQWFLEFRPSAGAAELLAAVHDSSANAGPFYVPAQMWPARRESGRINIRA